MTGLARFTIDAEIGLRRGYRRVRARFDHPADFVAAETQSSGIDRPTLLAAVRVYLAARAMEADTAAIAAMPDPALITTLCMACPFTPAEQQALLEAADLPARADIMLRLLRMGAASANSARPH